MGEEKDITIVDLYNLDTEWQNFPSQYRKAMDEAGELVDELSEKNSYYRYMKGQTYLAYSTGKKKLLDVEGNTVKKPTGPQTTAAVDSDEDLYKIQKEIHKLEKEVSIAKSYAEAMRQKKYALQNAVTLLQLDYSSELSVKKIKGGGEDRQKLEEISEKNQESSDREALKDKRSRRGRKDV